MLNDRYSEEGKEAGASVERRTRRAEIFVVFSDRGGTVDEVSGGRSRSWILRSGGERFRESKVIRESAEEIEKVLFSHESRILTPGGGAISPGGAGPPASPSSGHYHPPTHSPPLVKVSDISNTVFTIFHANPCFRLFMLDNCSREYHSRKKKNCIFRFSIVNRPTTSSVDIIVSRNWKKEKN